MDAHVARLLLAAILYAIPVTTARGQDSTAATVLCASRPCHLVVDWSSLGAAPSNVDRRYGAAAELEERVKVRMAARGNRLVDRKAEAAIVITVRPRLKAAMCDVLPGTNTDFSCRAFDDVALQFDVSDSSIAAIKALRAPNRCEADKTAMDVTRYSVFLASFIEWALDLNPKKKRPAAKC